MSYTAVNIPVNIPQHVSGTSMINMAELKDKVQAYVDELYAHLMTIEIQKTPNARTYSKRIQKLRAMSHNVQLTENDIKEDNRLEYLLSR